MKKIIFVTIIVLTIMTIYPITFSLKNFTLPLSNIFDYKTYYSYCLLEKEDIEKNLKIVIEKQKYLGYTEARYQMFTYIDNYDGYVETIYSKESFYCDDIPDPRYYNCEHTIPQSKFNSNESNYQKTDLHHLRPSRSLVNSVRGNYPYGIVKTVEKEFNGSLYGKNDKGQKVFEPRDDIKGDIARGMFYFSLRYNWKIEEEYEILLRKWHNEDIVTEKEFNRNSRIEDVQNNRNPFIDHPKFVDLIEDF